MKGLAAIFLLLAGCSPVPAERGSADHPTIVSLNPCSDAILAEIAPDHLLAISHYSHDPAATSMPLHLAQRFPATGGTVEEVLALEPDVVIADPFLSPAARNAFERLGVRLETVGIAATLEDSIAQIRHIAALAGREAQGEELVARIQDAWSRHGSEGSAVETLLWQQGGIVPGEATLAAQALDHAGFASHSAARGLGQGAYLPLEQVVVDPPELILSAGEERMLAHPALRELEDVRYEPIEPSLLFCGGPTIIRLLERLAEIRSAME